ncbi:uncharacterized protein PHALS_00490 [Plasmopara halstedii]|uniref:Uncharacterized protein n=1 Tax=Plasmopara halstedii TaxID=4781 RepID=A0A0P1A6U6_PLAHL|nr:uncharacterized protein PHALS_00490 [Plasmopara halstedii]CEG36165.1 hypothetical protein PHALS_00490 [Plasmopara halstedii]|eukprot:XP_024572534.1 hypothetical protein PHALS_00490 [Plasmopara halstedii]
MLSMMNSNRSVSSDAGSKTNLSSGSTNKGTSVAHVIATLASSESTDSQEFGHVTLHPAVKPSNKELTRHHKQISSAADKAGTVHSSVSRVSAAKTALKATKKRSTKSKCPPGLRSGKWTVEEETFTNMIIHYFKRGLLDVEDGTSLRWYLAKRLNCEAMRVTKKLKGNSSIGKQIFRSIENTPANREAFRRAQQDLCVVEAKFLESLSGSGVGPATQHHPPSLLPSSLAVSLRGRKIMPSIKYSEGQVPLAPMPQPKSEDARLLMHFFCEAHDTGSEDEPEDEPRMAAGSLVVDLSGKLGKKRHLSCVSSVDKSESDTLLEQIDGVQSTKRQVVETVNGTD